MCNEAVRGDMELESLKGRRDRCKLKWWYKFNNFDAEKYPRLLLDSKCEVKTCRGRQRKTWRKVVSELLLQLNLDSQEILAGDYNVNLFLEKVVKNYLQGVGDPGTRLMFKFRLGTNGLNEELGRHRGKNDDRKCKLCGDECESVVHVLWECPAYDTIRDTFMEGRLGQSVGRKF